jgi:hypothetical protein
MLQVHGRTADCAVLDNSNPVQQDTPIVQCWATAIQCIETRPDSTNAQWRRYIGLKCPCVGYAPFLLEHTLVAQSAHML